ncbi:MAG: hypothetical protein M3065_03405 [Actinomycetota bacterium]|nr:hypothetical protein [Actinomycetota bacterium]
MSGFHVPSARRGLISQAARLIVLVLGVATAWVVSGSSPPIRPRLSAQLTVLVPRSFVWVGPFGAGGRQVVELRSPVTGRVRTVLGTFGQSFTNNGLALSPDGRDVYVTLIPQRKRWTNLLLERIAVSDKKRTLIARGEQPAVSPDSQLLAYTAGGRAGSQSVAVRDLASGTTRSINIAGLIGSGGDPLGASVTWLADGSNVAVVPAGVAYAVSGASHASKRPVAPCHAPVGSSCLVIVHVTPAGQALTARRFILPGVHGIQTLSGDAAAPGSLLLAADDAKNNAVIDKITPAGSTIRVQQLLSIPRGLAITFDPAGRHLLYLTNTIPLPNTDITTVTLWNATIASGHLIDRERLIRNPQLGAAAW